MYLIRDVPQTVSEMEDASKPTRLLTLRPDFGNTRQKPYLTSTRESTLVEDAVYSLLRISSVRLTVIKGKGGQGNDNLAFIPQLVRLTPPKRQLTPPQQTDSTPTHLPRLQLPLGIWPLATRRHRLRIVQLIQPPQ